MLQVLFCNGQFQWARLRNLIGLAQDGLGNKLDLNDTLRDGLRLLLQDEKLRTQLVLAFTEDNRLVSSAAALQCGSTPMYRTHKNAVGNRQVLAS